MRGELAIVEGPGVRARPADRATVRPLDGAGQANGCRTPFGSARCPRQVVPRARSLFSPEIPSADSRDGDEGFSSLTATGKENLDGPSCDAVESRTPTVTSPVCVGWHTWIS